MRAESLCLGESGWQPRNPESLGRQEVRCWLPAALCLSPGVPLGFLQILELICWATGRSKFLHNSVSLTLWLSLSLCQNSKTISGVPLIGEKCFSGLLFRRQRKRVVPIYRASGLFYSIQLHKNHVN